MTRSSPSPSSSAAKRPTQETREDNRAECPFSVRVVDPKEELKTKSKKRRKRGRRSGGLAAAGADEDGDGAKKVLQQCAPFAPEGPFATHETMDVHYVVEPAQQWADMTRYNSFVLNGFKYFCERFVYVANDQSIERQKMAGSRDPLRRSEDDWVARILEIRASDEHHVYARVFWMYWPDELPAGTHYGKKTVQGRQPYHGSAELVASNHMDVINVVSVTSLAMVNHLIEDRDDDVQSALYWRQALDVRTLELSAVGTVCSCKQPSNPDKMLVGCGEKTCGKWIHEECLKHYALMRVYNRLGTDKPHISPPSVKTETSSLLGGAGGEAGDREKVQEPLSPKETGGAVSAQPSIDVKADSVEVGGEKTMEADEDDEDDVYRRRRVRDTESAAAAAAAAAVGTPGGHGLKREVTPQTATSSTTPAATTPTTATAGAAAAAAAAAAAETANGTPTPPKRAVRQPRGGRGSVGAPAKGGKILALSSFEGKKKPYDQLFEAKLLLGPVDTAPTMIEIHDLRANVTGGDKVWQEPAECPICGSAIR